MGTLARPIRSRWLTTALSTGGVLAALCLFSAPSVIGQARPDDALGAYYNWYKGKHLYERHCQFCHGASGTGGNYREVTPLPADLTARAVQEKSDADLASTIHGGKPGTAMGSWNWALSEQDRHDVVLYIRSLGR